MIKISDLFKGITNRFSNLFNAFSRRDAKIYVDAEPQPSEDESSKEQEIELYKQESPVEINSPKLREDTSPKKEPQKESRKVRKSEDYFTNETTDFVSKSNVDKKGLITCDGINIVAEYYRQKHPDRLKTNIIYAPFHAEPKPISEIIERLAKEQGLPLKLMLTLTTRDRGNIIPNHSHPYIVTADKLISLRDQKYDCVRLAGDIAKDLGKTHVEPSFITKSLQVDGSSCHMMSLATLKNLEASHLEMIGGLKDRYKVTKELALLLQYAQSHDATLEMLEEPELEKTAVIKIDKGSEKEVTLKEYRDRNFVGNEDKSKIETKISTKRTRMVGDLLEVEQRDDIPGTDVAARVILDKRVAAQKLKLPKDNQQVGQI